MSEEIPLNSGGEITPEYALRELSILTDRLRFARAVGSTYGGQRNLDVVLGYNDNLTPADYRQRFYRNPIAGRVIEAKPQSTWRGGGEIIEDENPDRLTPFEAAWAEMDERLDIWSKFHRVDVLAGFCEYSVLFIGAPGSFNTALTRVKDAKDIWYLRAYTQENAKVLEYEESSSNPRYGMPSVYEFKRVVSRTQKAENQLVVPNSVHFTRCVHVADGLLEDDVYGIPRLERIWNRLDDLDKVTGGGSEAFFKRADQGMNLNADPTIPIDKSGEADKKLQDEIDEYVHGLSRVIRTRGIDLKMLGSDVASFAQSVDAIIAQISAGTGIPQRILMGSERGHLASTQDKDNWDEQIHDRRSQYAGPIIVRPFVQKMIDIGALPTPVRFDIRWPSMKSLDDSQKALVAKTLCEANNANKDTGGPVMKINEIRDKILGLPPMSPQELLASLPTEVQAVPRAAMRLLNKRIAIGYYETLDGRAHPKGEEMAEKDPRTPTPGSDQPPPPDNSEARPAPGGVGTGTSDDPAKEPAAQPRKQ